MKIRASDGKAERTLSQSIFTVLGWVGPDEVLAGKGKSTPGKGSSLTQGLAFSQDTRRVKQCCLPPRK